MTDLPATSAVPLPAAPAPSALPALGVAALALLVALGAAAFGWFGTRQAEQALARETSEQDQLAADVAALLARNEALTRNIESIERRLIDATGVNQSLREEVLGIGQRAKMLEDAVARLADRQLSGAVLLRLNEVEFLLRLGAERLALFRDPDAAMIAWRLADAELAAIGDPLFASVRQTLAAELETLAAMPRVDRAALLAELDDAVKALASLAPAGERDAPSPPAPADEPLLDRVGRMLSQYLRVRRIGGEAGSATALLDDEARRAAITIELTAAKAALTRGDGRALAAALARARRGIEAAFEPGSDGIDALLATLERVGAAPLDAELPPLGRALDELRNLRATRSIATSGPERAPAPQDGGG